MRTETELLAQIERLKKQVENQKKQRQILWDAVDLMTGINFPVTPDRRIDYDSIELQFKQFHDLGFKAMEKAMNLQQEFFKLL